tara:strand:- start:4008 stop:5834 length:1827 start_codon:yes stop_codon:yes gene_type:complete
MAALSSALDTMQTLQLGENGTVEYGWSNEVQELITQFNFQLVRCSNHQELKNMYQKLLYKLYLPLIQQGKQLNLENCKMVYRLIGYTRDIVAGKGEYQLAYMLIDGLYDFSKRNEFSRYKRHFEDMAFEIFKNFVITKDVHPYGSWKDVKYFCNYHVSNAEVRKTIDLKTDILLSNIVNLICKQLRDDSKNKNKSLAARWSPRETSNKFGWLSSLIAREYYKEWFTDNMSPAQYKSATRKALTHYRQLVASINKDLRTPQINQCSLNWKGIDFDKDVTSITLRKQSKAFQGTRNGRELLNLSPDRQVCRENYLQYLSDCRNKTKVAKGKRVSIINFVVDAINLLTYNMSGPETENERTLLDSQWQNNRSQNKNLGNLIAMVDTSGSMECENGTPLHSAIGLGIRIAELSKIGKRVITFSSHPSWVNLEHCRDFVDMVKEVRAAPWGMNTNFEKAFNLILEAAVTGNVPPEEMGNFTLVILSDMQIDPSQSTNTTMFEYMRQRYATVGLQSKFRTPYPLPHIVFWNLRSTSGFPSLTTTANTTMISGNSPMLLNAFSEKGIEVLKDLTPFKMLKDQLENTRYKKLDDIMEQIWAEHRSWTDNAWAMECN